MNSNKLRKIIKKVSSKSGVYIFTNSRGEKLYIGKALNIKTRLSSYLKTADSRIQKMISQATNVKTVKTDSDIEALILESQYIKKYRPLFNIMMRDDKQYGFVGFNREEYPKVFITHQPQKVVSSMQQVVRRNIKNHNTYYKLHPTNFVGPFTDIGALKITLRYLRNIFPYCTCKQKHNNFCLNYHIGKCLGFCCIKNPVVSSKQQVVRKYRRNIKSIKDILSGKKTSLIKKLEREMLTEAKDENFEEAIKIKAKLEKLQRIFENAQIISRHYDILKNHNKNLENFKKALGLEKLPKRIECYDVSNIQGQNAAGSMVVFENGKPNKNEYRKFKIRTIKQASDTDMLKEILSRRFNHTEWPRPDLIIIDGGKGQLSAARSAILKQIPVIALTKNTKHKGEKITMLDKVVNLSDIPEDAKNLILAIDTEAHRFAINYYRQLHRKRIL